RLSRSFANLDLDDIALGNVLAKRNVLVVDEREREALHRLHDGALKRVAEKPVDPKAIRAVGVGGSVQGDDLERERRKLPRAENIGEAHATAATTGTTS